MHLQKYMYAEITQDTSHHMLSNTVIKNWQCDYLVRWGSKIVSRPVEWLAYCLSMTGRKMCPSHNKNGTVFPLIDSQPMETQRVIACILILINIWPVIKRGICIFWITFIQSPVMERQIHVHSLGKFPYEIKLERPCVSWYILLITDSPISPHPPPSPPQQHTCMYTYIHVHIQPQMN